jgi:hypothetical protein
LRLLLRNIFVNYHRLSSFEEEMKGYVLFACRELNFFGFLESLATESVEIAYLLTDIFSMKEVNFSLTSKTFIETVELLLTGSGKATKACILLLV